VNASRFVSFRAARASGLPATGKAGFVRASRRRPISRNSLFATTKQTTPISAAAGTMP